MIVQLLTCGLWDLRVRNSRQLAATIFSTSFMGNAVLLILGGGAWSLDAWLAQRKTAHD
jgi:hypothetical protein